MSRKKKGRIQPPVFFQTLSRPPEGGWPQNFVYHGSRAVLLLILAMGVTLLFPTEEGRAPEPFQEGDVATQDIAAQVQFDIPKDSVELARQRADAAAAVPPVFTYSPETQGRMEDSLRAFFDQIEQAVESGGQSAVESFLREEDLPSLVSQAQRFVDPQERQALLDAALSVVRQFSNRYLDSEHEAAVESAGSIHYFQGGVERSRDADDLLWGTEFLTTAVGSLGARSSEFQSIVRLLLIHFFESPYELDVTRTETRLAEARSVVPTVEGNVVPGEYIVRRGERIGPDELRVLNAHQAALQAQGLLRDPGRDWGSILGRFLLNLLLFAVFGLLLFFFRQEVYRSYRWVLLLFLLGAVYFLAAAGISWQGYRWELLPIAFVVLPVAILWDGRMALILALVLGILTGAQEPFNQFPILAVTVLGGSAAALSARAVRRRSQTWIFIALITLGYALAILSFTLTGARDPGALPASVLFAAMNATVSAILAMGFMPVFEWFTGITTDQTLLEWADPNRSLLKTLSLEASGTYAHTINVANLAEAAATAIGANGLLARVGIYYHDVGKMLKPHYFVENQPGGRNPHDKLKAHTSAEIVREHVQEGERMAREEGVPDVVARFIPEHHGTQLIGFFYERAREESEEEPDPDEFRYPGPKPQSKETAIAMLADSVESATRVLQDPSPERIRELVKSIIDSKVSDGQLSEAPLTLRELTLIQEQFVKVVGGMYHHRLDYPGTKHLTESRGSQAGQEEDEKDSTGSEGDPSQAVKSPSQAEQNPSEEDELNPSEEDELNPSGEAEKNPSEDEQLPLGGP